MIEALLTVISELLLHLLFGLPNLWKRRRAAKS